MIVIPVPTPVFLLRKIGGERVQIKYFISSLRSCQTIEDAVLGVPSLIRFLLSKY